METPTAKRTSAQPDRSGWRAFIARPRIATALDYVRRVYNGLANDNAFFLAGGLAFSLLLALVPFLLLTVVGLSFTLGREPQQAAETVIALADTFLPRNAFEAGAILRTTVDDILRTRGAVGLGAALGFVWTSTRLFGSLRTVLAIVREHSDRGIVAGKLFDVVAAAVTTVLVVVWTMLSTYLSLAGERGASFLSELGVQMDSLGTLSIVAGRLLGIMVLTATFFGLYRGLPRKRPSREAALIAAISATVLFEVARQGYTIVISLVSPSSLYTGTIAVIVSVVFWVYYGALLFVVGAEVSQAHELRLAEHEAAGALSRSLEAQPDPNP